MKSALVPALACLAALAALAEPVKGVVKSVDPKAGTLTLERESPPGALVTGFTVSGDLVPERVGTVVSAELRVSGGLARFEQLVPADAEGERVIRETAARLRRDTENRGRSPKRDIGEPLPELALRDQFGRVLTNADLRGKHVVISFIFTRCRAPEMCPASTRKMVELSAALKAAGARDVLLLSVSFDPAHDTPGVLKTYADGYKADGATHRFLTGPKGAIDDLRYQFGILTRDAEGTIVHNVATTLVGPDGRILYRADGPKWTADEFAKRIVGRR